MSRINLINECDIIIICVPTIKKQYTKYAIYY